MLEDGRVALVGVERERFWGGSWRRRSGRSGAPYTRLTNRTSYNPLQAK